MTFDPYAAMECYRQGIEELKKQLDALEEMEEHCRILFGSAPVDRFTYARHSSKIREILDRRAGRR